MSGSERLAKLMGAAGLMLAAALTAGGTASGQTTPVAVTAAPVAPNGAAKGARIGKLTWLCGVALSAPSPKFGGFSGLVVSADGARMTAVTDEGSFLTADLTYRDGCLTGLANARIGGLPGASGASLAGKRNADAEGMAAAATGRDGALYVSFERRHRILKYALRDGVILGPPQNISLPAAAKLSSNQGLEAIAVLQGGAYKGAIVTFAESGPRSAPENAPATGWMLHGGKTHALSIQLRDGFKITDIASLPNGDLIVLERFYKGLLQGVHMRIRRVAAATVKPGAMLDGETLIQMGGYGGAIDNMEGVAVHANADSETIITLISDDNFNSLQRTLLMQFALPR
ncbi:MAG: esterase-like activity of phytase family protein [Hyphomicrobiales bacterium]|nr:esterase-like activity of phytase family protein [Hyphomicrobiales bacterium]